MRMVPNCFTSLESKSVAVNTVLNLLTRYTGYIPQNSECCKRSGPRFESPTIKMAHIVIHQESHSVAKPQYRLLYRLNDQPPFQDAMFVGLQHVCAIFIPVVTLGLLLMIE